MTDNEKRESVEAAYETVGVKETKTKRVKGFLRKHAKPIAITAGSLVVAGVGAVLIGKRLKTPVDIDSFADIIESADEVTTEF